MRRRVEDLEQCNGTCATAVAAPSETCPNGAGASPLPAAVQVATPAPAPAGNHTPAGKFAPGNKLGKGNPFARRLGKLRSAFLDAVTDEDVAAVARKLQRLAMAGDVAAASLYLSYALGKPVKAVDVDRLDLDEFALLDAAPTKGRVLAGLCDSVEPAVAVTILHNDTLTDPTKARADLFHPTTGGRQFFGDELKARIGKRP